MSVTVPRSGSFLRLNDDRQPLLGSFTGKLLFNDGYDDWHVSHPFSFFLIFLYFLKFRLILFANFVV